MSWGITSATDDPDLWRYMVSPGQNELSMFFNQVKYDNPSNHADSSMEKVTLNLFTVDLIPN